MRRGWVHSLTAAACGSTLTSADAVVLTKVFARDFLTTGRGSVAERRVIELPAADAMGLGAQQFTCANPRCDEQFLRSSTRGRPKDFHSEDCRRAAERDLRRLQAQLAHHERQAEQLRARAGAYLRTAADPDSRSDGEPTDIQRQIAREAVAEVRGMARFLEGHQGEFAGDLLQLLRSVEPVVR